MSQQGGLLGANWRLLHNLVLALVLTVVVGGGAAVGVEQGGGGAAVAAKQEPVTLAAVAPAAQLCNNAHTHTHTQHKQAPAQKQSSSAAAAEAGSCRGRQQHTETHKDTQSSRRRVSPGVREGKEEERTRDCSSEKARVTFSKQEQGR